MRIAESIKIALRSLSANKLRSVLTMLGIIIGVAAVVTLVALGRGAQEAVEAQIQGIGTNLLFIRPGAAQTGGIRAEAGSAQTLTYDDALALVNPANAPSVALVAPQFNSGGQVVYQGENMRTMIMGVTPEYSPVRNANVADGEFVNAGHVTARSTVAVLGANVANTLFPEGGAVGQTIRINNVGFRVIGVMEAKGGTGFGNQDDVIFVPLTTAQSRLFGRAQFRGQPIVSLINVQVVDAKQTDQAIQEISNVLRERHRILYDDDFQIQSQQDILDTFNQVTGVFTLFLSSIAAISLVVGGIGIMNIMLDSVTERTREIGIRKAVGAKRRDILSQFLTEATILSVAGGVIGILVSSVLAWLIGGQQFGTISLRPVITPDSIALAVTFSVAVGLFFGIYPATRAAALNPIDALRYE